MIGAGWGYCQVRCDDKNCLNTFGPVQLEGEVVTAEEADEIRRRARKLGWSVVVQHQRIRDLCPICTGREARSTMATVPEYHYANS